MCQVLSQLYLTGRQLVQTYRVSLPLGKWLL